MAELVPVVSAHRDAGWQKVRTDAHSDRIPRSAIEMFAVAIIVIALVPGTIRYLIRINQQVGDAYSF